MISIFNYNTLATWLNKKNRSLHVEFKSPSISSEMVFELESLLAWTASHLEINSILLTGPDNLFSTGLDQDEMLRLSDEKLQKLLLKLQRLIYSFFFLPQTVIVDLKEQCSSVGAELAIGADIRLAQENCQLSFSHLSSGLVPSCGGVGFLNALIPSAMARNWLSTGKAICTQQLLNSGFIQEFYSTEIRQEKINEYLQTIAAQAPIARIQYKRSILENILPQLDQALEYEKQFAFAAMASRDWESAIIAAKKNESPIFASARELASKLKQERKESIITQ